MQRTLPVNKLKITVIVASFNTVSTLRCCIDSVLTQRGLEVELIVIDGGSQDGTAAILQSYGERIAFWLSEADNGIYDAWNKALKYATGEWVHFVGADDTYWDEYALARMAKGAVVAESKGIGLVYGQVALIDENGNPIAFLGKSWELVKNSYLDKMPFPHPGVLHRRILFERYGVFDESFKIAGDYEWFCRVLQKEDALYVQDAVVVRMSLGGASTDPKRLATVARENARAREKNGIANANSIYGRVLHYAAIWLPCFLPEKLLRKLIVAFYKMEGAKVSSRL